MRALPRASSWGARLLLVGALLIAVYYAGAATKSMIADAERQRVYGEMQSAQRMLDSLEQRTWRRERDSLRAQVATADAALLDVLARAARITSEPPFRAPTPLSNASWRRVPAEASAPAGDSTRTCAAMLDTVVSACARYRAATQRALALTDSQHRADSLRALLLTTNLVGVRDTLRRANRALVTATAKPGWWVLGGASAGALIIGIIVGRVVP
ncbi:MAG TPA: hypothetical protein VE861_11865 [Gemmatimonadaceae bacterium]|nr:hypothetical protein [Gemmatimonadaceae bacterium]